MISAVIQDNEERVGQLADGEVARLLSVLQNAEFTRSDKHDLARNSSFKQRSLIEIAAEAKQSKGAIEIAPQASEFDGKSQSNEIENFQDEQSDSSDQSISAITGTNEESLAAASVADNQKTAATNEKGPEETIRDLTSKKTMDGEVPKPEIGVRGLTSNSTLGKEMSEQEQEIRGLTSVQNEEVEDSEQSQAVRELTSSPSGHDEQTTNSFETANAAFERGKVEGISEGRLAAIAETKKGAIEDAKAELANIVDAFVNTLDTLARPKAMQTGVLSSSIHAAILKLASERAGIQINDMPDAFSNRISALVTSIGQKLADGKIQLNKEDYAAMKPYVANSDFQFVVNPDLMRGDVALQFDGVELQDIAANRMASHYAERLDNGIFAATDDDVSADAAADLADVLKSDELLPPSDETDS